MTEQWRHLHPLTPWFRGGVTLVVLVGALLNLVRDHIFEAITFIQTQGALWLLLGVLAIAMAVTGYSLLWWHFARFRVGVDKVELKTGFIFRQRRSFRLDQLEAVDVVHPLVARLFGLAKLTLESAGGADSQLLLAYLRKSDAESIRAELLGRRATPLGQPPAPSGDLVSVATQTVTAAAADMFSPAATASAEERPLFQIPIRWTVRSFLRSPTPWGLAAATVAMVGVFIGLLFWMGPASLPSLVGLLSVVALAYRHFKNRLLDEAWFTAFTHPDGLRLRHGLTTTINQTIPARRIQAIRLTQSFWWRKPDWWRIEINVAGYGLSSKEVRTVLVPVADPTLAAVAIQAVMPEAVAPHTWALLDQAMHYDLRPAGFAGPSKRAGMLDPWTWCRNGYAASPFALVFRTHRFRRTVDLVPHDRIQQLHVTQGPLERRLGLANVLTLSMPGPIIPTMNHLDVAEAARLLAEEAPKAWFPQRVA
ncbi:MAG: PH domain-containing protein [Propionibacteriaceae bacterium]|jgi:putative membrane protein|nr:PH domain-containing protein [Propionibacteriaceae bacterium]